LPVSVSHDTVISEEYFPSAMWTCRHRHRISQSAADRPVQMCAIT
jgi:hypothetical protein